MKHLILIALLFPLLASAKPIPLDYVIKLCEGKIIDAECVWEASKKFKYSTTDQTFFKLPVDYDCPWSNGTLNGYLNYDTRIDAVAGYIDYILTLDNHECTNIPGMYIDQNVELHDLGGDHLEEVRVTEEEQYFFDVEQNDHSLGQNPAELDQMNSKVINFMCDPNDLNSFCEGFSKEYKEAEQYQVNQRKYQIKCIEYLNEFSDITASPLADPFTNHPSKILPYLYSTIQMYEEAARHVDEKQYLIKN